jgi:hypothetical protein
VLAVEGITYIYRQINWPSKFVFVRVLAVEGVTYIY